MLENTEVNLSPDAITLMLQNPNSWLAQERANAEIDCAVMQMECLEALAIRNAILFSKEQQEKLEMLKELLREEQEKTKQVELFPELQDSSASKTAEEEKELEKQKEILEASIAATQKRIEEAEKAVQASAVQLATAQQHMASELRTLSASTELKDVNGNPVSSAVTTALTTATAPQVPLYNRLQAMAQSDPLILVDPKAKRASAHAHAAHGAAMFELGIENAFFASLIDQGRVVPPSMRKRVRELNSGFFGQIVNSINHELQAVEKEIHHHLTNMERVMREYAGLNILESALTNVKDKLLDFVNPERSSTMLRR